MKAAPISLRSCYFTEVRILSQAEARAEDLNNVDVTPKINVFSPSGDNPWNAFIIFRVIISAKDGALPPYYGELEVMGDFQISDSWPEPQIEKLVYVNGSGMLYSAVREMVCNITARGLFPLLLLPSISFFEMFKDLEASRSKEQAEATSQSSTALEAGEQPPSKA